MDWMKNNLILLLVLTNKLYSVNVNMKNKYRITVIENEIKNALLREFAEGVSKSK